MIEVSESLKDYIHTSTEFMIFDLYEITMPSGKILRFTDCEINLRYDEKDFVRGPLFHREKTKQTLGISSDVLKFHMFTNKGDKIDGTPIVQMAQSGAFDGANMKLMSAYLDKRANVIDVIELFQGVMAVSEVKQLDITFSIKPKTADLTTVLPNRLYYPSCPYTLFSEACGLKKEDFEIKATVTSVEGHSIRISGSYKTDYFASGSLLFTSGALQGYSTAVVSSDANTIHVPLPFTIKPKVGDTVTLLPGCNKSREACKMKFNNESRWRGTPYVPRKEETV